MGQPTEERPEGFLLWIHVSNQVDAGCAAALAAELSSLRDEPVASLVTSTENAAAFSAVSKAALHQLVPGETSGSVQRFIEHWHPDVGVIIGPPDRPTLISESAKSGVPLFLAVADRHDLTDQGRLSIQFAELPTLLKGVIVVDVEEQKILVGHGFSAHKVAAAGLIGDTALAPPCDEDECDAIARSLAGRPVWLACNVLVDEIPAIEIAQRRTIRAAHRLLLIIIPRNPEDGGAIAAKLEGHGWRTALRSTGGEPEENVQVYIADTPDDLGLWYRLSPITYLGGSFDENTPVSDPFEPASLGSAVVHGPEVGGSVPRIQKLQRAEASLLVQEPTELGDAVFSLLSPDKAAKLAHAGWRVTTEAAPAVEALATMIHETLEEEELA